MKPNVLITIDTYSIGGPGKLILQFLRHGGRNVCSPIVAGFWRGPEGSWQFRNAVEAADVRFEVLRQVFAYDPLVISAACRLVRNNGIHLLESHGYKSHILCLALRQLLHIPWVAYVHGWTSENLKVDFYNYLEKRVVPFADRIVTVSKNLGTMLPLGKMHQKKLVCIPNAIEPAISTVNASDVRAQLGMLPGEMLLGVVGRLSPEKGHRDFLMAFHELAAHHKQAKAVFVGDGQERQALASAIQAAGLANRVLLVGYQEDVSRWYRACDIVILPSHREGMPMVALEAMSYARPVVATRVGGIPEVIEEGVTGCLVDPQNPAALTAALSQLMRDPGRRLRLGEAGRRFVAGECNPERRVSRIAQLYQELMSGRVPEVVEVVESPAAVKP